MLTNLNLDIKLNPIKTSHYSHKKMDYQFPDWLQKTSKIIELDEEINLVVSSKMLTIGFLGFKNIIILNSDIYIVRINYQADKPLFPINCGHKFFFS